MYEENDNQKAADLLSRAVQSGGPPFLGDLASSLYLDTNNLALAESLLNNLRNSNFEEKFVVKMQEKIDRFKTEGKFERPKIKKLEK